MKLSYELDDDERSVVLAALRAPSATGVAITIANKIEKQHHLSEYNEKIKNMTIKDLLNELVIRAWNDGNEGREQWSSEITLVTTRIHQKLDELESEL